MSSGPSSSSGWLKLWGSQENFPEQPPGDEGGTNPSILDGSVCCWAAGAAFTQALLSMGVSLLLAFCSALSRLQGCAALCLLTHRYLTESMELLGVLTW